VRIVKKQELLPQWKRVSAAEALAYAAGRVVLSTENGFEGETVVTFTDQTALLIKSEYEGLLSDVTPGAGIEPPSWYLNDCTGLAGGS
jgi:hypothetical protein